MLEFFNTRWVGGDRERFELRRYTYLIKEILEYLKIYYLTIELVSLINKLTNKCRVVPYI